MRSCQLCNFVGLELKALTFIQTLIPRAVFVPLVVVAHLR